jgi:hypothetical protein
VVNPESEAGRVSTRPVQARPSLPSRVLLGVVNRSRKVVRHSTNVRKTLRRGVRLTLQGAKAVRHAIMRRRLAWRNFRYRSRWTAWGSAMWRAAAFTKSPRETRERTRLAREFSARAAHAEMSAQQGCLLMPPDHFADMPEVLATCRQIFEAKVGSGGSTDAQEGEFGGRRMKSEYLRNLLTNEDLRRYPVLVDFALSDAAMGMAASYLGTVPNLNRVDLLYSIPRPGDDKVSSQLFHVDPEGLTQVKFFINIFDVGDSEGPFTFIPADETARIIGEVAALRDRLGKQHAGRYLDDEIAAVGAARAIIRVTGPQGSGVAVDTSRCLHMGSRVRPGSFRLCLYIQYCTTVERGNAFDVERYRDDRVRHLAVQHSAASAGGAVSAPHQMDN